MPSFDELFTGTETDAIIMALLTPAKEAGVREEDILALFEWAHQVRVNCGLLEGMIAGKIQVARREDGEWLFRVPKTEGSTSRD